jgi:hypothetical protein
MIPDSYHCVPHQQNRPITPPRDHPAGSFVLPQANVEVRNCIGLIAPAALAPLHTRKVGVR